MEKITDRDAVSVTIIDRVALPGRNRPLKAWRSATEKYVYATDGRDEYYDLRADPREHHNLIEQRAKRAKQLQEQMLTFLVSIPRYELGDLQSIWPGKAARPEIAERLQAMGLYRKVLDWPEWAPR